MGIKDIFSNKPRCQHFHENGSRCKADPQTGKPFCFFHDKDPGQKQKQAEARKQGGQARSHTLEAILPPNFKLPPLKDLSQINDFLDEIAGHVAQGEMDLRTARFFCYIANTKLAVMNAQARQQRQTNADKKPAREKFFFTPLPRWEARSSPASNSDEKKNGAHPAILGTANLAPSIVLGKRNQPQPQSQSEDAQEVTQSARQEQSPRNSAGPDSAASTPAWQSTPALTNTETGPQEEQPQNPQPAQEYERVWDVRTRPPRFIARNLPKDPPPCPTY